MMAQANGHPNIVAQFLIPLILWRLIKLRSRGTRYATGWRSPSWWCGRRSSNEELLFITAVGFAIFLAVYGLIRRKEIREDLRPFLRGGAVAAAVRAGDPRVPLYFQFFGAQHYRGLPEAVQGFGADLASFPAYSSESLAATRAASANHRPETRPRRTRSSAGRCWSCCSRSSGRPAQPVVSVDRGDRGVRAVLLGRSWWCGTRSPASPVGPGIHPQLRCSTPWCRPGSRSCWPR